MKHLTQLTALMLLGSGSAYANSASMGTQEAWLHWFGNYHFIFLHFPIALIIMACIAELLLSWKKDLRYDFIVNFLLISAAILVIPTVLSGLSLGETKEISSEANPLLEWHEIFGFITLSLTLITVILRKFFGRNSLYLWSLFVLLICVIMTSHLGGMMAIENYNLLPPFF